MAESVLTVEVLRGSIPSACFAVGEALKATVGYVDGLTSIRLTIAAITVGSGDTDTVTFGYDDVVVPDGVSLAACNLTSFQCAANCCQDRGCYEIIGPADAVSAGIYLAGWLPVESIFDQVRVYSAAPTSTDIAITLKVNGEIVFADHAVSEGGTIIDRTEFLSAFASGLFAADSKITVEVTSAPTYDPWLGLTVCLLGVNKIVEKIETTFDFVVQSWAELVVAPPGSEYYKFPYIYVQTGTGGASTIERQAPDTWPDFPSP